MITKPMIKFKTCHRMIVLCKFIILTNFVASGQWNVPSIPKRNLNQEEKQRHRDSTTTTTAHFDESTKTLSVPKLDTKYFVGNSLNFQGADVANVHLVNVTIDGHVPHLAINTLEIKSESASPGDGIRMATFDPRGGLSTVEGVKWDEQKETLQVKRLSSLSASKGIDLDSDVDMNSNTLRNFKLDDNTTLKNVKVESSFISNTKLSNVTLDNLSLGSIKVDSLSISQVEGNGSFLTVTNDDGTIESSSALQESRGSLLVKKKVEFTDIVKFKEGSTLEDVHITSGNLDGGDHLDLNVNVVKTNSLVLKKLKEDKRHLMDELVIVRNDGSLTSSKISINDGWIGDMKICGNLDFKGNHVKSDDERVPGKILGAVIEGGKVEGLENLSVSGHASINENLNVKGETFLGANLVVGGSVLGSGPYIDVSDERLKTNIERISFKGMLERLTRLQAIRYDLLENEHRKNKNMQYTGRKNREPKEIGFLAQEVKKIFPDLVSFRSDGFLGVQYSRFVPLLVEGMQDIHVQIKELRRENELMKANVNDLKNQITCLLEKGDNIVLDEVKSNVSLK